MLRCRDKLYNIPDIEGEHTILNSKAYRKEKLKADSKLKSEMYYIFEDILKNNSDEVNKKL